MSADVLLREAPPAPALAPMPDFAPPRGFVTVEQYFQFAENSEFKVEYIDGAMFEMPKVMDSHLLIQRNVSRFLHVQIDLDLYPIHSGDASVRTDSSAYVHPDLSVVRGVEVFAENRIDLLNPVLVVEVHSKSTRSHDIINKLPRYLAMPGLEHILYIEQDIVSVTHHARVGGEWTRRECNSLDDILALDSLGVSLSLAQVYRGVMFP